MRSIEVERKPKSEQAREQITVRLVTPGGKVHTAVGARIFDHEGDGAQIIIHRNTQGRDLKEGETIHEQCESLGGANCVFTVRTVESFPSDPKEQGRVLVEILRQLHPSMLPPVDRRKK